MRIKRTNSFTKMPPATEQNSTWPQPSPKNTPLLESLDSSHPTIQKSTIIYHKFGPHNPPSIKESISQEMQSTMKSSKMGSFMRNKLKSMANTLSKKMVCEICEGEISKGSQVFMCRCEHKNNFCQSCLLQHCIYKVKMSQEVYCPHEGCRVLLDSSTKFFKNLPIDIQRNYKTLRMFSMNYSRHNLKICPNVMCLGVLEPQYGNFMVCNTCSNSFCPRCLHLAHIGPCAPFEVKFFQCTIAYEQCKRCQSMVKKVEGSRKMSCKCGIEYCYVCGQPWQSAHESNHNQQGELTSFEPEENKEGKDWLQGCLFCKVPLKLVMILIYLPVIFLLYALANILLVIFLCIISIFMGIFGFSFELLSRAGGALCILGAIFLPVTMLIGIGIAFKEVFWEVTKDSGKDICSSLSQKCDKICKF